MTRALILVLALLGPVEGLDWGVQRAVQNLRSPALEPAMRFASSAGKPATVFGLLLGIAVLGGSSGVETARLALLAAAPTNLVVEGLKRLTDRTRPDGEHRPSNSSFPSSHAANAFALAAVFAFRRPRVQPWVWLIAAVIAFSRVYLNRHFMSDVVVGAAIGIASAWAVGRLVGRKSGTAPTPRVKVSKRKRG
jgi:membrane-associated phospholipid phosphatase